MQKWILEADIYRYRRALGDADPDQQMKLAQLLRQTELRLATMEERRPRSAIDLSPIRT